jgi:hypothetical protein
MAADMCGDGVHDASGEVNGDATGPRQQRPVEFQPTRHAASRQAPVADRYIGCRAGALQALSHYGT